LAAPRFPMESSDLMRRPVSVASFVLASVLALAPASAQQAAPTPPPALPGDAPPPLAPSPEALPGELPEDQKPAFTVQPVAAGPAADAKRTYQAHPAALVSVGTVHVPFARGALESSRHLAVIERSVAVKALGPERRLGLSVEGRFLGGRIGYLAGWLNGTEGF